MYKKRAALRGIAGKEAGEVAGSDDI